MSPPHCDCDVYKMVDNRPSQPGGHTRYVDKFYRVPDLLGEDSRPVYKNFWYGATRLKLD